MKSSPSSRRPSAQALALGLLSVAAPLGLVLCFVQTAWTDAAFAAVACVFPIALMLLGVSRRGRAGAAVWPIGGLGILLGLVMVGLFHWRGQVIEGPWWGGLPAATALQLYGIFLLPLFITSFAYAWTFDGHTLDADGVDSLRRDFPQSRPPEAR